MNLNEQYFDKAMAMLEARRRQNKLTEEQRHNEVCRKIPEYAKLEELLADTSRKLIMIIINDKENAEEKLKKLEEGNLGIQRNMTALLKQGGFPEDYLQPIYSCPICQDKGTANSRWCECFQRLMLNAAAEELNSVSPLKLSTFDSFRLDYYSDENDPAVGASPRAVMKRNLEFCKSYAESFTLDSNGIYMSGGTGLGKTHLSLAIADAVIRKGHSVIYGSAPELLRVLEREFYGRSDGDTMDTLTKCDLLILDDLGAEMEKQQYTSLVYELVNARVSRNLPMVVSSNLSVTELQQRYHDRICSRLFSFEMLMFIGADVRRKISR